MGITCLLFHVVGYELRGYPTKVHLSNNSGDRRPSIFFHLEVVGKTVKLRS